MILLPFVVDRVNFWLDLDSPCDSDKWNEEKKKQKKKMETSK